MKKILCLITIMAPAITFGFNDVDTSHPHKDSIEYASMEGIVEGYGDGTFGPEKNINYAEAAKMIAETYALNTHTTNPWYNSSLQALESENAQPNNSIQPSDLVTRGQMVEIIYQLRPPNESVSTTNQRPNIILLMTDDQGWNQTGYNEHPHIKTPNLDTMAANGLQLNNFYASAPICSPTRVSVLTGQHHVRSACYGVGCELPKNKITLAEILQDNGYTTGHFGKWHIGKLNGSEANPPSEHGFDESYSHVRFFDIGDTGFYENGVKTGETITEDGSDHIVSKAIPFIERAANNDQPFFAVIWYGPPHNPYIALEEDKNQFPNHSEDEQNMYSEILAMDRSIGTLRTKLKDLGIHENTLLWFNGDNGGTRRPDGQANADLNGYKGTLYEGGIKVPAVIEWPKGIAPQQTNTRSNTLDIYATILDITGIQPTDYTEGTSLVPLFSGENIASRGMGFWYENNEPVFNPKDGIAVWIQDDYKLIKKSDQHELYNLNNDPNETQNIANQNASLVQQMADALEA